MGRDVMNCRAWTRRKMTCAGREMDAETAARRIVRGTAIIGSAYADRPRRHQAIRWALVSAPLWRDRLVASSVVKGQLSVTRRSPRRLVSAVVADVRYNRGRRLRRWVRVRRRRWATLLAKWSIPDLGLVYPVAFGPNGSQVMDAVRSRARNRSLGVMFGGDPGSSSRFVHVPQAHMAMVLDLLLASAPSQVIVRRPDRPDLVLDRRQVAAIAAAGRSVELLVVERIVDGRPPHRLCSRIRINVWRPGSGPYGTEYFQGDAQLAVVGRLSPRMMRRLASAQHDFDTDGPAPGQPRFPIDVVYTWVDGDDPQWLEQKRRFAKAAGRQLPQRVAHDERFRSRDELRYSLRSIEQFAPWVRQIFIVTAGQVPAWLDTSHPKIRLVFHDQIYSNLEWLPTFNSSGIETQLHHIDGLSRYFLYFNDDFMLGQLTDPADFFLPNGVLRYFPSEQRVYESDIDTSSEEYVQADKNAIQLMTDVAEIGRAIMRHAPYPSDRELLAEMEARWHTEFAACASARFRSSRDLRPIAFMQYHYGFASGRAVPSDISHRYLALWKPGIIGQLEATARSRLWKTICINDVGLADDRNREVSSAVGHFLRTYYPVRSSFERVEK